jgi:hypothetical protein
MKLTTWVQGVEESPVGGSVFSHPHPGALSRCRAVCWRALARTAGWLARAPLLADFDPVSAVARDAPDVAGVSLVVVTSDASDCDEILLKVASMKARMLVFDLAVDRPALWDEQRERVGLPR